MKTSVSLFQVVKSTCLFFIILAILTGIIYPFIITGISQVFFPNQANGSLIYNNEQLIGSKLIGQKFSSEKYFWGRPSATTPFAYNAIFSQGSNYGPSNPEYIKFVKNQITHLETADPTNIQPIPIDLITASASGLDPDISPQSAYYQAARVARARNISVQSINELIKNHITNRSFRLLGEERVNVLELNLALDQLKSENQS